MKQFTRIMLVGSFSMLVNTAFAQAVQAPSPIEGDTWEYQTVDLWSSKVTSRLIKKTIGVSEGFVRMYYDAHDISRTGETLKPQVSEGTVRADMNVTTMYRGERMEKTWYKWPLEAGKKWSYQVKEDLPPVANATQPQVMTTNIEAEVKGWEVVETPLGKYKAMKINYKTTWSTENPANKGNSVSSGWYCPDVKGLVQYTYESIGADGSPQSRTKQQLLRFFNAK